MLGIKSKCELSYSINIA